MMGWWPGGIVCWGSQGSPGPTCTEMQSMLKLGSGQTMEGRLEQTYIQIMEEPWYQFKVLSLLNWWSLCGFQLWGGAAKGQGIPWLHRSPIWSLAVWLLVLPKGWVFVQSKLNVSYACCSIGWWWSSQLDSHAFSLPTWNEVHAGEAGCAHGVAQQDVELQQWLCQEGKLSVVQEQTLSHTPGTYLHLLSLFINMV